MPANPVHPSRRRTRPTATPNRPPEPRGGVGRGLLLSGLLAALGLGLGACADVSQMMPSGQPQDGPTGQPAGLEKTFNRFPDIPVPTDSAMDVKRTLVFGGGEAWYGQLAIDTRHDGDSMFDFYKQELPGFGWEEITSVRAPTSVLTYMRGERVLSIQVEKGSLTGSAITVTVSPRGGAAPK